MILLACAVWLALVIFLSNLITRLMTAATSGYLFRLMIFPGVLVHELSHYAMCKLTGARVVEVKLFGKQQVGQQTVYGGHVTHGPSKLPLLGDPLISFAPVFGCLGVMALLTWFAEDPLALRSNPAQTSILNGLIHVVGSLPLRIVEHAKEWKFWVYLYLTISLAIALAPSKQDFANSYRHFWRHFFKFILAAGIIFLIVYVAGTLLTQLMAPLNSALIPYLVGVFAFTLSILVVTLIFAWLINLLMGLVRR